MGNIFSDIVEEVKIKPSYSKTVLKWTIRIAILLIGAAFTYGQIKSARQNRLSEIQKSINENATAIKTLSDEVNTGFDRLNTRIDKIYVDGYDAFENFQVYNKKQLEMIIDYGGTNKEMLKRMLDIVSMEQTRKIETELEQTKGVKSKDTTTYSIIIKPKEGK